MSWEGGRLRLDVSPPFLPSRRSQFGAGAEVTGLEGITGKRVELLPGERN